MYETKTEYIFVPSSDIVIKRVTDAEDGSYNYYALTRSSPSSAFAGPGYWSTANHWLRQKPRPEFETYQDLAGIVQRLLQDNSLALIGAAKDLMDLEI